MLAVIDSPVFDSGFGPFAQDGHECTCMLSPTTLLNNRYLIKRTIEEGGMGIMYEAEDQRLITTCAINETSCKSDHRTRMSLEREASLMGSLRHPALPKIIDYIFENDKQYLVMQFVPGENLAQILERWGKPFKFEEVMQWTDQLLGALEYLHAASLLHRNINPQALKLNGPGEIMLLGLGLYESRGALSTELAVGHTPLYASPEQLTGQPVEARSDLYSLAATLYYLLTLTQPPSAFERMQALLAKRTDPLRPVSELNTDVPTLIADGLAKAMSMNPEDRPSSAGEMRTLLREARDSIGQITSTKPLGGKFIPRDQNAMRAGSKIGPYTLLRKLGQGNFGVVWLGEKRSLFTKTQFALKFPLEEEIDLDSVRDEAERWQKASGHPNILPIVEADIYDDQVVIVSEFASDGSLEDLIRGDKKTGKTMPLEKAVDITSGMLRGLEHLHSRLIIHRDLKPANILLQGGIPRLSDFGISRVLKSSTHSGSISGTPAYMAPEAFDGVRSEQTDLWSVGIILYQLLCGHLPFPQVDLTSLWGAIARYDPEPLPLAAEPLQAIVSLALQKDSTERYKSATDMRRGLQKASQLITHTDSGNIATIIDAV